MNAVERVKKICKERKIPISRLESDLGFGNAYIYGLKKGTFPDDRLKLIAEYLGVSIDYLMTGEEPKLSNYPEQVELLVKIRNDKKLFSAIEKYYALSDRQKEHVLELIDLLVEA